MFNFLNGFKTKMAAVGLMIYALGGFAVGHLAPDVGIALTGAEAYKLFLTGLGFLGVKMAIENK